jgi:hypothetical protein
MWDAMTPIPPDPTYAQMVSRWRHKKHMWFSSACRIQCFYRVRCANRTIKMLRQARCACRIQRQFRKILAAQTKVRLREIAAKIRVSLCFQMVWRQHAARMRLVARKFCWFVRRAHAVALTRRAVSEWRAYVVHQQRAASAATFLQKHALCFLQIRRHHALKESELIQFRRVSSAALLQSVWKTRRHFRKYCAQTIQRAWRTRCKKKR